MAGAELEIRFTGTDPDQQQAFDKPDSGGQGTTLTPPAGPPDATDATAANRPTTLLSSIAELQDVISVDLVSAIDNLTDQIEEMNESGGTPRERTPREPKEEKNPGGFIERMLKKFDETVNKTLDNLGQRDSRAGRAVRAASQSLVNRGTKVSKVIGAAASRVGLGGASAAVEAGSAGAAVTAALGPVAIAAAVTGVAFVGAAYTVKKLSDAMHGLADQLEDLSPAIALVRAQHEARQTIARLDRAGRIGPEVAQLEAARDRIQESMFEVQTKILELLLKGAPTFEFILDAINVGTRSLEVGLASINATVAVLTPRPQDNIDTMAALAKAQKSLADAIQQIQTGGPANQFGIDPFFQSILNTQAAPGAGPPHMGGFH